MVAFKLTVRRHLIRLASAPFTSIRLAKFGWAPFTDFRVRRLATKHTECRTCEVWIKTPVPFLAVCGPKFMIFWDNVGNPSCFAMTLPDCLWRVSFRRLSPLNLKVVEKSNKCKSVLAPNFWGATTPTFLRQIVSAIYCPSFGKVWLSSVCRSPFAKPSNEAECRIYGGWVKCTSDFNSFVDQCSCCFATM